MATSIPEAEALLRRPLYVFNLPERLLANLSSKTPGGQTVVQSDEEDRKTLQEQGDNEPSTSTSCSLCQVLFESVDEQREHVKSDHHRYNVKARLRGTKPLNEADFNKAVGELDESISGSESESDDEEEDAQKTPDDTLTQLLKRQAKLEPSPDSDRVVAAAKRNSGKQPLLWFTSPLLPPTTYLGIYRALFTNEEQDEPAYLVESLRRKQTQPLIRNSNQKNPSPSPRNGSSKLSPQVFLCMIGGGHFAAMIVALAPEVHKQAGGVEERQARVIAHKTFHRYTTRRKQGGAQSTSDAKGVAHSAGSSLRRYNEAALENEIRQLLKDWKSMIDESQLLLVRAAGTTNRRILFGPYEGQVLKLADPRIRNFPFNTRRATQSELMRAFTELTRVKVSHIDAEALAKQNEKPREEVSKSPKPTAQRQKPKLSKEEEETILHTTQIQALIRRSKVPALLSYLQNNSIPPSFQLHPSASQSTIRCPTPLHLAASSNSPAIVTALLTKANADPTVLNGEGKPAFDIAGDRATRDAFRVARHELGESAWDWETAHVPSAMSKADVTSREEREKKAADEAEAQRRKEELERLRKEDANIAEKNKKGGRTLAAIEKTGAQKREEEMRGMSPEMRMRLERERRARAAEERFRRMQSGSGS